MKARKPRKLKKRNDALLSGSALAFCVATAVLLLINAFAQAPTIAPVKTIAPVQTSASVLPHEETVMLPVSRRNIAAGEQLRDLDFTTATWKKSDAQHYISNLKEYPGATALTPLYQGLPIPISAITQTAQLQNAVVERIPPGMRAITVSVDIEASVEGWARSGSYVDVILLRKVKETDTKLESTVIAENVRILSVGQSTNPTNSSVPSARLPQTVTLLVTQENTLRITTAASLGRLTFSLRAPGDDNPTLSKSVSQADILGEHRQASSSASTELDLIGRATGPKGEQYVLTRTRGWMRAPEEDADLKKLTSKKDIAR